MSRVLVAVALLILFFCDSVSAQTNTPVGRWRTVDDETKVERSIVEIMQENGVLTGRILQLLNRQPGEEADPVCTACEGDRLGKKVIGMVILWGLRQDGDDWTGGSILDPKNGQTYGARLRVTDGGEKLQVRGFIGIPLLGRTQTWLRHH